MLSTAEMNKALRATRSDGERSRQTILQAAARLATVDGLDGLSIGHLAEHIGMSKSGLYAHFGSKEELQLATVETALEIFNNDVIRPTERIEDPLLRVEALCDSFLDYVGRRVFPGGCFFAAVAAEFDTHPGPVKESIAAILNNWLALFEELFEAAQRSGRINPAESPAQLVFETDAYLLMANMVFVLREDSGALERARRAIKARIAVATQGYLPVTTAQ
jgi:AcrR family transcriptional regulator